ncbi:MAG TPA: hypothetical protein VGE07_08230 [Herpetosiphonaceae bacterium]
MTLSNDAARAAYLAAHPDEQTAPHLVDLAREAKIVSRALRRLPPDFLPRDTIAFATIRAALEQTAGDHRQDQAYFELVGIDRIWAMADSLARNWMGQQPGAKE